MKYRIAGVGVLGAQQLKTIGSYNILSELGRGSKGVVYEVEKRGEYFALKLLHTPGNGFSAAEKLQFRKEAAAISRLRHPNLIRVVDVGEINGQNFLVTNIVRGRNLDLEIRQQRLPVYRLMLLARTLADVLHELHRYQMVHRDIKPSNIVINEDSSFHLIDLGLVGDQEEIKKAQEQHDFVGTLQYAAPEQIGVLKRPVDGRSDLYALGITLYEAAVGQVPFTGTNITDLIQQHAVRRPEPIHNLNPTVPKAFSLMVQKLLAKDPDDRYQSAKGLMSDLDKIDQIEQQIMSGQPWRLGENDKAIVGLADLPLAGREQELTQLRKVYLEALSGHGGVATIEGEPGGGKTRLSRELLVEARANNVLVLRGKCNSLEGNVPLAPLREAFDSLVNDAEKLSREMRPTNLNILRSAAEGREAMVSRLSSGLEKILEGRGYFTPGDQNATPERFREDVVGFIENLSVRFEALVFVIDDIQWADSVTLDILQALAERLTDFPLMLILMSRNDSQSVAKTLVFKKSLGAALKEDIRLLPLSLEAVATFLRAQLGDRGIHQSIVEKLKTVSNGNPFIISEYVSSLLTSGALFLREGQWELNEAGLRKLNLATDVFDLVLARSKELDRETRDILACASVVGMKFHPSLLAAVTSHNEETISGLLQNAEKGHLIESLESGGYQFVHDRIREAIYQDIPGPNLQILNQQLAEFLSADDTRAEENIFLLARCSAAGEVSTNPELVFRANARAGILALENYAYDMAIEILSNATDLRAQCKLEDEESFSTLLALGKACMHTGRLRDAHEAFTAARQYARNGYQNAEVLFYETRTYSSEGDINTAWSNLLEALKCLDKPYPQTKFLFVVSLLYYIFAFFILRRTRLRYGFLGSKKKSLARDKCALLCEIYDTAFITSYLRGSPTDCTMVTFLLLYYAHFLGDSREMAKGFTSGSLLWGLAGLKGLSETYVNSGLAVAERIKDPAAKAYVEVYAAAAMEFAGDAQLGERLLVEAFPGAEKYTGTWVISQLCGVISHHYMFRGYADKAVQWSLVNLPVMEKTNNISMMTSYYGCLYSQSVILGGIPETPLYYNKWQEYFEIGKSVKFTAVNVPATQVLLALEHGDVGPKVDEAIEDFLSFHMLDYHHRFVLSLIPHLRLRQLERAVGKEAQKQALKKLQISLGQSFLLAPTPIHRCHYYIAKAGLFRFRKKYTKALELLIKAEQLAVFSDSVIGIYHIARERARIAQAQGQESFMKIQIQDALNLADRHGWKLRRVELEKEFALKRAEVPPVKAPSLSEGSFRSSSTRNLKIGDRRILDSLLQVSLSSTHSFDPLEQANVALDEIVKVMGAERAFAFLWDEETKQLNFICGRDAMKVPLDEPSSYSRTVVRRVRETRKPLVVTGSDEMEQIGASSAVIHDLRSIIATPLILQDQFKGVVYLDSRLAKGLFTAEDVEVLSALANHITIAFETTRLTRVEVQRRELAKDLEITAAVQKMFLPLQKSVATKDYRLNSFYRAAAQCSGDWWWYKTLDDGRIYVAVGDVTGHGAGPAMITATIAACFRILEAENQGTLDLKLMLHRAHNLLQGLARTEYLMSLMAFEYDPKTRSLRAYSLAAPSMILITQEGEVRFIGETGTLLGNHSFEPGISNEDLQAGDRLFIFTDGITEMMTEKGRSFGDRRLIRLLIESRYMDLDQASRYIQQKLDEARGKLSQEDDFTFVIFDVK